MTRLAVALSLAVFALPLQAADTPDPDRAEFNALSPVINALIQAEGPVELMERAEALEDENLLQALTLYIAVARERPNSLASYKASSLLARRGDDDAALIYLEIADERGVLFPLQLTENPDFDDLRQTPIYLAALANAQRSYDLISPSLVGATGGVLLPGADTGPAACRPVVVWLHGYGSNGFMHEGFQSLADAGAILLGINGTEMLDSHTSFRWSSNGFEQTHVAVQKQLDALAKKACIDRKRVYLMGFSQGALHGGALLAQHPDAYAGALLMSPGGRQPNPTTSKARGKRVVVINGEQEGPGNLQRAEAFRTLFGSGNEVQSRVHDGEHEFPDDWQRSLPAALRWMMESGAPAAHPRSVAPPST